jgi:hypothetical protein
MSMFRCIVSASARDVILRLSPTNLGSRLHPTRDGRQAPVSLFSTSCLVVFLSGSTLPTTVPTYCVPTLSTLHLAAHIVIASLVAVVGSGVLEWATRDWDAAVVAASQCLSGVARSTL